MASMYSVKLRYDDDELAKKIDNFPKKLDKKVDAVFEYNAAYGTGWMKANAPWHDDTGAARASLLAVASSGRRSHEMLLSHGVHYGIWLEVAHNRKYQILASAQRHIGTKLMFDMRRAFAEATK